MCKYLSIIFSLLISLSLSAQNLDVKTKDISSGQKAIRTSTDILAIAMPAATLTGVIIIKDWTGLKQGIFTALTTAAMVETMKYTIHKRRPDGSNNRSFPSGHTAVTFADAAFVQRRYGWKFGIPAYLLAAYTGWGRTYADKHDWWDVLTGAAIGAASAYIYTRPLPAKTSLVIAPVSTPETFGVTAVYNF